MHPEPLNVIPEPTKRSPRRDTGSIRLTDSHDGPLLEIIRNATFISCHQLIRLALATGVEKHRGVVAWRAERFVRSGLVDEMPAIVPYRGSVYSITRSGLAVLESYGHGLVSITSETEHLPDHIQVQHFLELNEVHIAFLGTGQVAAWLSDREIRSLNYTVSLPFVKDYDAVVYLNLSGGKVFKLGIEYERSLKSQERYAELAAILDQEKQLQMVVYLTSAADIILKLAPAIHCHNMVVCFAPAQVFRQQRLLTQVAFIGNGKLQQQPLTTIIDPCPRR